MKTISENNPSFGPLVNELNEINKNRRENEKHQNKQKKKNYNEESPRERIYFLFFKLLTGLFDKISFCDATKLFIADLKCCSHFFSLSLFTFSNDSFLFRYLSINKQTEKKNKLHQ